jgi:hypothetical protein
MCINNSHSRINRERKTIEAMINLFCRNNHMSVKLCSECRNLLLYARNRLEECPFQERKPTCAKCSVHCYQQSMREQIRVIMRYSGPRMFYHHPILSASHFIDEFRSKSALTSKKLKNSR